MKTALKKDSTLNELHIARDLEEYKLLAVVGDIGHVEDFYFDDLSWTIRYLVVKTGGWLTGRQVLISPVAVDEIREADREIYIGLTREQIDNSPPLSSDKPVSRQYEEEFYKYYNWPPYWEYGPMPGFPLASRPMEPPPGMWKKEQRLGDSIHLRSAAEVKGYSINANDGEIGHVEDFIIDTQYWVIRYLEVDTRNWWPGKHVLVNPGWIKNVSWADGAVEVDLNREVIKSAPAFDPNKLISREYESRLFKHYGWRAYWEQEDES